VILVFGTICVDRVRKLPRMPDIGGYVEVESEDLLLGGEAANTANALRLWGAEVVLAGNGLGAGGDGDFLRGAITAQDLPLVTSHIIAEGITPVCDVFVTRDGERTMIGSGFSAMEATVDPSKLPFEAGQWFTAEPNMRNAAREAVRLAHSAGMKTYTMDFVEEDDPIYPGAYWQCSTDWAGVRGNIAENLAWVRRWVERFGCFTILTDGARGFIAGSPDLAVRHYPGFPVEKVVDATGAGDLFRAGMLFGLDRSWPVERCLRFASVAGALACGSFGATVDVPSLAEIEALL
jgi:sugar/nucleoside kinase (ribokinase family)